jgi:hypothetical protein
MKRAKYRLIQDMYYSSIEKITDPANNYEVDDIEYFENFSDAKRCLLTYLRNCAFNFKDALRSAKNLKVADLEPPKI